MLLWPGLAVLKLVMSNKTLNSNHPNEEKSLEQASWADLLKVSFTKSI